MAHLDRPYSDWPQSVCSIPFEAMGLRGQGRIAVGGPADFVIFRGRRYSELLSRPQFDRVRTLRCDVLCAVLAAGSGSRVPAAGGVGWGGQPAVSCPHPHALRHAAPPQVVVRGGRPLNLSPPPYEELDYIPDAIRKGEAGSLGERKDAMPCCHLLKAAPSAA